MLRTPSLPEIEPEPDDDGPLEALADLLEPPRRSAAPVSIRARVQVEDMAFADTVYGNGLDDALARASGPVFFDDRRDGSTRCVTPLAFPPPAAASRVSLATRMRVLLRRLRAFWRTSYGVRPARTRGLRIARSALAARAALARFGSARHDPRQ